MMWWKVPKVEWWEFVLYGASLAGMAWIYYMVSN